MSEVPKAARLSFADAQGTLVQESDGPAKLRAMLMAADQARQREVAAVEFRANRGSFVVNRNNSTLSDDLKQSGATPVRGTLSCPPGDLALHLTRIPIKGLDPPLGLGLEGLGLEPPVGLHTVLAPMVH